MSVIHCDPCGKMVDLDWDVDHCHAEDCDGCPCDPEHWYMWYTPQEAHEMRIEEGMPPLSDHELAFHSTRKIDDPEI